MRKTLIVLLILIWPVLANAGSVNVVVGQPTAVSAVYTDCSQINGNGNTNSFAWFGDHSSGNTYGCKDSTTSINASTTEGTRNNTTPSSNYSKGVNVKFTAASDFAWAVTGGDLVSVTEGLWQLDVYQTAQTGNTTLLQHAVDGNNKIYMMVNGSGAVACTFFSGGNYIQKISTATLSTNTWTTVAIRYKNTGANSRCDVKVGANAWETGTDTLSAWVGTGLYLNTNSAAYFSDTVYIDNIFVSKTSGL